jgi:hypothetical protein
MWLTTMRCEQFKTIINVFFVLGINFVLCANVLSVTLRVYCKV